MTRTRKGTGGGDGKTFGFGVDPQVVFALPDVRIGTSGWSYKEWEGVFYEPKEKNKLTFYARYFNTVEIDSTFYAYPNKGVIIGCQRNTPDGFVFSAKLPKLITHDKRLDVGSGVREDLLRFLELMKPLIDGGKLGPLLVQLAPSFAYGEFRKLESFLEIIPTDLRFAVEFRHRSWLRGETWDLLKKHSVANTIVDEPLLPPDPVVTADFAFIRMHGRGSRPWYNYRYKDDELVSWARKTEQVADKARHVFQYFNNHFHGYALDNALRELKMLGKSTKEQDEEQKRVSESIEAARSLR